MTFFLDAIGDALDLLLPSSCLSCRESRGPLCPGCRGRLAGECRPLERAVPVPGGALRVVSAAPYAGSTRALILALKRRGRRGAARLLAPLLLAALRLLLDGCAEPSGTVLVAAPPTSYARRVARGFDPVRLIARRAGLPPPVALRRVRSVARQSTLGRGARERNLVAAFRVTSPVRGHRVVLIDDVVTTGSTLRELARAVRESGGEVLGAATAAHTPGPGTPRRGASDAQHPPKVLAGNVR